MSSDWKKWCRLCGRKHNSDIDVFIKDENFFSLSEAIQKFLTITICDVDEAPKKICTNCQEILNNLVTFSIKAAKVQEMFSELQFNDKFELFINIDMLREKYGLEFDEKINLPTSLEICNNNVHMLEQSIEAINSETESTSDRRKRRRITKNLIKTENSSDDNIGKSNNERLHDDKQNGEETSMFLKTDMDSQKKSKNNKKHRTKNDKIYCEICEKSFTNQGGYKWHLKMTHKIIKNPETFPCQTCGKIFRKLQQLKIHENMHLPPDQRKWYSCPHCDKKFSVENSINSHIRIVHIKEKSFICEECGKSFVTNDALNSHKLVHTDYAPFQCPKCSKCFKRLPSLKNHLDSHDDTKYICPICGLQLNTKTTLRRHMVIHSDEKKYKCNFCGNQFKRSKALKNHLILHTGLKPYECPFCEQTFANGSNCRKHQKNSHSVELAAMENAGEKKICRNVPRLEHLKAVNNAALSGIEMDVNHRIDKINYSALENLQGIMATTPATIVTTTQSVAVTTTATSPEITVVTSALSPLPQLPLPLPSVQQQ